MAIYFIGCNNTITINTCLPVTLRHLFPPNCCAEICTISGRFQKRAKGNILPLFLALRSKQPLCRCNSLCSPRSRVLRFDRRENLHRKHKAHLMQLKYSLPFVTRCHWALQRLLLSCRRPHPPPVMTCQDSIRPLM